MDASTNLPSSSHSSSNSNPNPNPSPVSSPLTIPLTIPATITPISTISTMSSTPNFFITRNIQLPNIVFSNESVLSPDVICQTVKHKIWTNRQFSQLIIQLIAFSQLIISKSINDNVRDLIAHFETAQLYKQVHDPIVYLTSVIRIRYRPTPLPPDFIVNAHSDIVQQNIINDITSPILQARWLKLLPIQESLRNKVGNIIQPLDISRGRYRNKKAVDAEALRRNKQIRKSEIQGHKQEKKKKRLFTKYLDGVVKEFNKFHKDTHWLAKKLAQEAARYVSMKETGTQLAGQNARLKALKARDESEYIRLVKETKNERLLYLLQQTDQFMAQLGSAILQEQKVNDDSKQADGGVADLNAPASKKYYAIVHKVLEEVDQPKLLVAGQLREYQKAGLNWLVSLYNNNLNGILADEMGLGKTVQTISLLAYLMETKNNKGPFLIITPMSVLRNNWEVEFNRWFPSCVKIIYDGDKEERRILRHEIHQGNFNVLMTTFEFAMRDRRHLKRYKWEYVIVDEAHRLKNPNCKLVQDLNTDYQARRRVALTGTPLQNDIHELWSLLNFLHPHVFNAANNFEKWFAAPFANMGGNTDKNLEATEEEKLLVVDRLHAILRPFLLRRIKSEVEKQLPPRTETVIRCKMSPLQALLYDKVENKQLGLHNTTVQLRKVCNHPLLFHPWNYSIGKQTVIHQYELDYDTLIHSCGKMEVLDKLLDKLFKAKHRVLLFCQMTKMMDILESYFEWRNYKFCRLDGTTPQEVRQKNLIDFNAPNSPYFIFMLSTKAGGLGLNLQSANTVILYDSDWNPQNDLQAQARAHRIGQKQQVIVLRLCTSNSIEESVLQTAKVKLNKEAMVIEAGMFNDKFEDDQHHELLTNIMSTKKDDELSNENISENLARTPEELVFYEQIDRESVIPSPLTSKLPVWVDSLFVAADARLNHDAYKAPMSTATHSNGLSVMNTRDRDSAAVLDANIAHEFGDEDDEDNEDEIEADSETETEAESGSDYEAPAKKAKLSKVQSKAIPVAPKFIPVTPKTPLSNKSNQSNPIVLNSPNPPDTYFAKQDNLKIKIKLIKPT